MKIMKFIREWALIIAMVSGVVGYLVYENTPFWDSTHEMAHKVVNMLQPLLIFLMLFFTFCKIDLKSIRLRPWHGFLLLIQCVLFVGLAVLLIGMEYGGLRIVLEGAMICLICPTATAAAVITRKLGGNVSDITTYTILINMAAAVLIPALLPYVHPNPEITSWSASLLIVKKVFPLLLLPLVAAVLIKLLLPSVNRFLIKFQDAPFYLWLVSLTLAMVVTTRSVVHSEVALATQAGLVIVSLASCVLQFWLGRRIGLRYGDRTTAGQALGQKNTVLAIWIGYTFFTPITSMAGGFYSVWHNIVNSYQLYKQDKATTTIVQKQRT